jgi:hypothetical protein
MAALMLLAAQSQHHSWREGPPLRLPRFFHASAATPTGELLVFGGWVMRPPGIRDHGLGGLGVEILGADQKEWRVGPNPPEYHYRYVNHFYAGKIVPGQKRLGKVPAEDPFVRSETLVFEAPFAGSDALGRIQWFTNFGPIFYDPKAGAWSQLEGPVIHKVTEFWSKPVDRPDSVSAWKRAGGSTATGPDGRLYLTGGTGWPFGEKPKNILIDALEVYDAKTDSWATKSPMAHARQVHASAFGPDGLLYVFGGCGCLGGALLSSSKDPAVRDEIALEVAQRHRSLPYTEAYDPATDTWTPRAPMPEPRQEIAAVTGRDGLIYVIGGGLEYGSPGTSRVDIYDPATDTWREGPSLRQPREGHAAAMTPDGKIWVTGGVSPHAGVLEPVRMIRGDHRGAQETTEYLETAP